VVDDGKGDQRGNACSGIPGVSSGEPWSAPATHRAFGEPVIQSGFTVLSAQGFWCTGTMETLPWAAKKVERAG
jgi:hypothetical protein